MTDDRTWGMTQILNYLKSHYAARNDDELLEATCDSQI